MKSILLSFLLFASFASAADFGGADKQPFITRTGGTWIVTSPCLAEPQSFSTLQRADEVALYESLKCADKDIEVKQPTYKIKTAWRAAPSASSSKSSAVASSKASSSVTVSSAIPKSSSSKSASSRPAVIAGVIKWTDPQFREDGKPLGPAMAYHIRQKLPEDPSWTYYEVAGDVNEFKIDPKKGEVLIAFQDRNGIFSDFVPIDIQ
jgi:hypothetical protein